MSDSRGLHSVHRSDRKRASSVTAGLEGVLASDDVTKRRRIRSIARGTTTGDSEAQQPRWRNVMQSTAPSAPLGHEATVQSLMSKDLAGDPGKELLLIAVEYPPGSVDPVHTHHAQSLVYVLDGAIEMQVKG